MRNSEEIDTLDRLILDLLTEDGRRTFSDIAERVRLSPSPVKRRIERMERLGIITGYSALIDHHRLGAGLEAFTELRFTGNTVIEAITRTAARMPEVVEVFTIAGDLDALIHLRVDNMRHLQEVVNTLRLADYVISTKTLMVLGSWRRSER